MLVFGVTLGPPLGAPQPSVPRRGQRPLHGSHAEGAQRQPGVECKVPKSRSVDYWRPSHGLLLLGAVSLKPGGRSEPSVRRRRQGARAAAAHPRVVSDGSWGRTADVPLGTSGGAQARVRGGSDVCSQRGVERLRGLLPAEGWAARQATQCRSKRWRGCCSGRRS